VVFVKKRQEEKGELKYTNENYGFPVMTRQELKLKFPTLKSFNKKEEGIFEAEFD